LVNNKKINGISDLKDLTDRNVGLRLVIEVKNGFNPEGVLAELYRLTPMEESFGINNVALVDGQPRTLGLREMLQVYIDHRIDVVRRRSAHRRKKREDRLHLVEGILIALLNIDEVIRVIRESDDASQAKQRLIEIYELTEIQAQYILDTPLRRLTRFDKLELEKERDQLTKEIAKLTAILESERKLRNLVSKELGEVAAEYSTPRRTVLLEASGQTAAAAVPLEVEDTPCLVLLSSTGLMARTHGPEPLADQGARANHDVLVSVVRASARAQIGAVTSAGRMIRVEVIDLPTLPPSASPPSLAGGAPVTEYVRLEPDETIVGLSSMDGSLALGTEQGVVKRVVPDYPPNRDEFEVIGLKEGDRVLGAATVAEDDDLVFITSDTQLLHFSASNVRPQGRAAGGMAGIKLAAGAKVIWFGALDPSRESRVVTISGSSSALPGTQTGSIKVSDYAEFPAKGRATGGVRSHRFLKGEDTLIMAWAGPAPVKAATATGKPLDVPAELGRRDGSGEKLPAALPTLGGPLAAPAAGPAAPAEPAEE
jgi:DNA gyrase subunit A